jgi:rare lipoprotein A
MIGFLHSPNYFLKLSSLTVFAFTVILLNGCASEPINYSDGYRASYQNYHQTKYLRHSSKRKAKRLYRTKGKTKSHSSTQTAKGYKQTGIASWYGAESGSTTAMGTRFRPEGISAAHRTLPLPSKVRVTNLHNGRSIVVVVNDRGPYAKGRIIDLSHGAAKKIGMDDLAKVEVEYLGRAN